MNDDNMAEEMVRDSVLSPITIFVMDAKGVVARIGKFIAVEDGFLYFLNERDEEEAINTRDIVRFVKAIVPKRG